MLDKLMKFFPLLPRDHSRELRDARRDLTEVTVEAHRDIERAARVVERLQDRRRDE